MQFLLGFLSAIAVFALIVAVFGRETPKPIYPPGYHPPEK
jgi:hypothetical protein